MNNETNIKNLLALNEQLTEEIVLMREIVLRLNEQNGHLNYMVDKAFKLIDILFKKINDEK